MSRAARACVVVAFMTCALAAQNDPAADARFDVASIRSCEGQGGRSRTGTAGPSAQSPGTLYLYCLPLKLLIQQASDLFADGQSFAGFFSPQSQSVSITGGPDWIDHARYTINAKAEGTPRRQVLQGPMLRTLLEERFKLKIRRESRDGPVYTLTVAASGLKVQPLPEGSCASLGAESVDRAALFRPGAAKVCGVLVTRRVGGNTVLELRGMSMADLAKNLGWNLVEMPVVDQTGVRGMFDFRIEFAPDETTTPILGGPPRDGEPAATAPSVLTALQEQVGLKLAPARGPRESLVIEHIERPSEN